MFTLSKISIDEGKDSNLRVGYASTFPDMILFKWGNEEDKIQDASLKDVAVGYQIFLHRAGSLKNNFHRTSKIKEIVLKDLYANKIIFHTETSLYELTEERSV